jgi:heme exporter protein D
MESIAAFFEMGGYARFIWPSFGMTFVVLTVLLVTSLRRWKQEQQTLTILQAGRNTARRVGADGNDAA